MNVSDPVNHPAHYADGPVPGVECIEITQWFNFNLGNAIKYIWRHGRKGDPIEDLRKARTYIEFEIERLTNPDPFAHLPIPDSEFEQARSMAAKLPPTISVPSLDQPHRVMVWNEAENRYDVVDR